jgi:hypothetical protein
MKTLKESHISILFGARTKHVSNGMTLTASIGIVAPAKHLLGHEFYGKIVGVPWAVQIKQQVKYDTKAVFCHVRCDVWVYMLHYERINGSINICHRRTQI